MIGYAPSPGSLWFQRKRPASLFLPFRQAVVGRKPLPVLCWAWHLGLVVLECFGLRIPFVLLQIIHALKELLFMCVVLSLITVSEIKTENFLHFNCTYIVWVFYIGTYHLSLNKNVKICRW